MNKQTALIKVSNLTVGLGKHIIVDGFYLTCEPGQVVCMLGSSGGGKTTALKAMAGQIKPKSGKVTLNSHNISWAFGGDKVSGAGFGFTDNTAEKLIKSAMQKAENYEASYVSALLDRMGLWDVRKLDVSELSEGQQKALSGAMMLSQSADGYFADDLVDTFDPRIAKAFWEEMQKRVQKGAFFLYTTRIPSQAEKADYVIILERGRAVAEGTPEQLKSKVGNSSVVVETDVPEELKKLLKPLELHIEEEGNRLIITAKDGLHTSAYLIQNGYGWFKSIIVASPTFDEVWQTLKLR